MPSEPLGETPAFRADLVRRLRCAAGHVRGIAAMVEGGADCESLVRQTRAVQGALGRVNCLILKHHVETCVRVTLSGSDSAASEACLAEVVSLYQLLGVSVSGKEHV